MTQAYRNADTLIVPLTDTYNKNGLPLPENFREGVAPPSYSYQDVPFIPIRPHAQKDGVVSNQVTPPNPQEIPMSAFFRGGNLDGQV